MHPKVEKIKNHLQRNKVTYFVGTGCLIVGAAGALVLTRKTDVLIAPKIIQFLNWKPEVVQKVIVTLEEKSNLSKPVRLKGTDKIFASQNEAARQLGVTPNHVSRQLRGLQPDIKGLELEWLPKVETASQ